MRYIFCLLFIIKLADCFLNKNSWIIIKNIKTTYFNEDIQKKIDQIIFINYKKLAFSKASKYKLKHNFKCKNIPYGMLVFWAEEGLLEAIQNYNYSRPTNFGNYASKHIQGSLHQGLTNQFPINRVLKHQRRRKNKVEKKYPIYLNNYNKYISSKEIKYEDTHKYEEIWLRINKFDKKVRRIFYLKFDEEFSKIRSNRQVADLMCYSEENIRKIIKETITIIKSELGMLS